ncbi:hypothetical protein [Streptomyces sp. NPDC007883]|uniref:hypothetical protein n=1 Tax=Streptomyces sp. NPDC007883 TaxID=3155116 RepID=UPI0034072CA4
MDEGLWSRLSAETRAEVDGHVAAGRTVRAIVVMRERAGLPQPELRDCVDLLAQRFTALREHATAPGD